MMGLAFRFIVKWAFRLFVAFCILGLAASTIGLLSLGGNEFLRLVGMEVKP